VALDAIHTGFAPAYGPPPGATTWWGLEVDFKFDGEQGQAPSLYIKQARPHPGRGQ
jgi:pyruvate,water dikinase